MHNKLLGWLTVILLFPSCAGNSPDISVVCEENNVGNHIIKWETLPAIEGKVKIYASTHPEKIEEKTPVAIADISQQRITIVTTNPNERFYYKLVFNNRYEEVVASRNVNIPGIQNFRDIGGYSTPKRKETRWGMLYRSGEIDNISYSARKELQNIGIKTIVDLRSEDEITERTSTEESPFKTIHIPIGITKTSDIVQELRDGKIKNDSVYRLMIRVNQDLVTYYRKEYRRVFDVLLDKANYPVVIQCNSGKGRTAIASALVLSALGMSDDIIMYDYRLSNEYFDIPTASSFAYNLPSSSQEAITTLFSARESFLNAAFQQIGKNYGDTKTYLTKGLGLTEDEIKHLKTILLD